MMDFSTYKGTPLYTVTIIQLFFLNNYVMHKDMQLEHNIIYRNCENNIKFTPHYKAKYYGLFH